MYSFPAYLLRMAYLSEAELDKVMFETASLCIWTLYKYQPSVFQNNMVTKGGYFESLS